MSELKEALNIDLPTLLLSILIVVGGLKVVIESVKWFIGQFGIEFKRVRKRNEEHDLLIKTIGRLDEVEKSQTNMIEESKNHNSALKADIDKLTMAMARLNEKFDSMIDKTNATKRADLKDKIAQRYRKYSVDKQWTAMEKEAFIGLIRDYEEHGGENSFVHTICEPESYTWVVVDNDADVPNHTSEVSEEGANTYHEYR